MGCTGSNRAAGGSSLQNEIISSAAFKAFQNKIRAAQHVRQHFPRDQKPHRVAIRCSAMRTRHSEGIRSWPFERSERARVGAACRAQGGHEDSESGSIDDSQGRSYDYSRSGLTDPQAILADITYLAKSSPNPSQPLAQENVLSAIRKGISQRVSLNAPDEA